MKRRTVCITFLWSVSAFLSVSPVLALNEPTHEIINEQAARRSTLDQVLKDQLGFPKGIETVLRGDEVFDWIGEGGIREDEGGTFGGIVRGESRFFRHFHDPLYQADGSGRGPWAQAGLRLLLSGQFDSSIHWMQQQNQDAQAPGTGNFSWQDARRHFRRGLTGATPDERAQGFADTFRALGQIMHLVVDASVPEHVRNDAHPGGPIFGNYEYWVLAEHGIPGSAAEQSFINTFLAKPIGFDTTILQEPTNDPQAPVPIARLIDADRYTGLTSGPNVTFKVTPTGIVGTTIGIAEVANANFFSENTGRQRLFLPNYPFPDRNNLVPSDHPAPESGLARSYFKKATGDGLPVDPVLAECVLDQAANDAELSVATTVPCVDKNVWTQTAKAMLPRAVGYSAGLLDYFFRGRLEVDLVQADPTDPSVVQLSGTNASSEKLDGGTLTLYADDPATGTRGEAAALDPTLTVTAAPGAPVLSARFRVPAEAERFVAVYRGRLGNEGPQGAFPGGVAGKVLGGVRVESIYPEGEKRLLRTVAGVFPLPPTADRLERMQWGDQDNTVVGTLSSSPDPRAPDQLVALKINRPLGSTAVPLVAAPDGTQVVSANVLKAVDFPYGLSLGVTVNYSETFHLQQFLLTFDVIGTGVWNGFTYADFRVGQVTSPSVEVVVDQPVLFSQSFPIVLDRAHLFEVARLSSRPYSWRVEEVGLDAQGRLLALVKVRLTLPEDRVRPTPFRARDRQGRLVESTPDRFLVFGHFQVRDLGWALIDVEQGKVLGVTSSPTVTLSSQHGLVRTYFQRHNKFSLIGGPQAGQIQETWEPPISAADLSSAGDPNFATTVDTTLTLPPSGPLSRTVTGRFRADLEPLLRAPSEFEIITRKADGRPLVYFVDQETNRAVQFTGEVSSGVTTGTDGGFPQAQMIRPTTGASPEVLLLSNQAVLDPLGSVLRVDSPVVRWAPQAPSKTALALPDKLPPAFGYSLRFTTSQATLLEFTALERFQRSTLVVDFGTKQTRAFPGQVLTREYVLLEPKFLYNFTDTRFHTLDPTPRATVLPRPLAAAPAIAPPRAAYHVLRLP